MFWSFRCAEWVDIISYSWPLKRQIQMHEGFEYASNKKKEGLIWPTSINKTHSCVVKIVGKSMNEIMKNRWCIYDLRTKYNVLRRTIPLHWKWKLTLSVWHLLANKTNKHLPKPLLRSNNNRSNKLTIKKHTINEPYQFSNLFKAAK